MAELEVAVTPLLLNPYFFGSVTSFIASLIYGCHLFHCIPHDITQESNRSLGMRSSQLSVQLQESSSMHNAQVTVQLFSD